MQGAIQVLGFLLFLEVNTKTEDKERARRQQLRRLKMKFGLTVNQPFHSNYFVIRSRHVYHQHITQNSWTQFTKKRTMISYDNFTRDRKLRTFYDMSYDKLSRSRKFFCKSGSPYPPLDSIRVMVIVWRLRGNIIRTASCWVM